MGKDNSTGSTRVKSEPLDPSKVVFIEIPDSDSDDEILEVVTIKQIVPHIEVLDDSVVLISSVPDAATCSTQNVIKTEPSIDASHAATSNVKNSKNSVKVVADPKLNNIFKKPLKRLNTNGIKKRSSPVVTKQMASSIRTKITQSQQNPTRRHQQLHEKSQDRLPQLTHEHNSHQQREQSKNRHNQRNPQPEHYISTTRQHLCMSIVDMNNFEGRIPNDCGYLVEQALANYLANTITQTKHWKNFIAPRFDDYHWSDGHLCIDCPDETTRNFLINFTTDVQPLWAGCRLSAIQRNGYKTTVFSIKSNRCRIELYTNHDLPNYELFMRFLDIQNPQLNVKDWYRDHDQHMISYIPFEFGTLCAFYVDRNTYNLLLENGGYVYCGVRRFLFNLQPDKPFNLNNGFFQRMLRCNIKSV